MQKLNTVDLKNIQSKLYERLKPSGWGDKLKGFLLSDDFYTILDALLTEAMENKRFTPTMKQLFKAFEECPYRELSIVIVGQDPYPQFGVADGIAFSCSKTDELQPSLKYILEEINRSVYKGHEESKDVNLARWSNQGVLMLNTALTTTIGKIGQHYNVWKPFLAYLFDYLTWNNTGLVYIYLGKQAKEWSDAVNDNNYKFYLTHPASAAYNNLAAWDSKSVFVQTSDILLKNNNKKMIW